MTTMFGDILALIAGFFGFLSGAATLFMYMKLRRVESEMSRTLNSLRVETEVKTLNWVLNVSSNPRLENDVKGIREQLRRRIQALPRTP